MTTPIVSTVTAGPITTGQVVDITGTHMMDESQSSWIAFHQNHPTAGQMQGTSLTGMGYDTSHNADWTADPTVKLFGTKSFKNHSSGQVIHDGSNAQHGAEFDIFGAAEMGSASATIDVWYRMYVRFDVGVNGEWPNTFGGGSNDFKLMSKYQANGFWASLDVPDSIGVPPSGIRLTPTNAPENLHSSGPTILENRWYCIELKAPVQSNNTVWQIYVDDALVYSQDLGQGITWGGSEWYGFFINWYSTSAAFDQFIWCNGIAVKNNGRIKPSCVVEIANSSTYASATKRYQAPEFLSDTSSQIKADLTGLGAGPYWLFVTNNLGQTSAGYSLSGGGGDTTPPILTLANAGTPTSVGTQGAHFDTNEANGTFSWASYVDGSTPLNTEVEGHTGTGVYGAGSYGSQAVTVIGQQNIASITGLPSVTNVDLFGVQRDQSGNLSGAVKVDLLTLAASLPNILLTENFADANFGSRGWFDTTIGTIDTAVFSPDAGNSSLKISWTAPGTGATNKTPVAPRRHTFTATDAVYVSYWQKLGTAAVPWQGSGQLYHPHTFQLLTNVDDDWIGPSNTNLSVRLDINVFTPRFNISDGLRLFTTNPYPDVTGVYPNNSGTPSRLGTSSAHAVMGGNGKQVSSAAYYDNFGGAWENTSDWIAPSPSFLNNTWHHIEAYVVMNTIVGGVPQANGVLKYWVDGVLVISYTNVYLRTAQFSAQKFNKILLVPYIGDGSPIAQDMWIDNLTVMDALPGSSLFKPWFARGASGPLL